VLFELAKAINRFIEQQKVETEQGAGLKPVVLAAGRELVELGRLLGLFLKPAEADAQAGGEVLDRILAVAVEVRQAAKSEKDFATADAIRNGLARAGVTLEDRPGESTWRVEGAGGDNVEAVMNLLIEVRASAKKNKDFETADLIRDRLAAAEVTLEDRADGTIWRAS
jgi:cysteinyl-tRNA synthetase